MTEQQVINHCRTKTDFIVYIKEEDLLLQYLGYDGNYNLAVCLKCEYTLPLEWIYKHFKDSHKVKVYYQ
jgi:hypothetical protein